MKRLLLTSLILGLASPVQAGEMSLKDWENKDYVSMAYAYVLCKAKNDPRFPNSKSGELNPGLELFLLQQLKEEQKSLDLLNDKSVQLAAQMKFKVIDPHCEPTKSKILWSEKFIFKIEKILKVDRGKNIITGPNRNMTNITFKKDKIVNEKCLKAKDYAGCMEYESKE